MHSAQQEQTRLDKSRRQVTKVPESKDTDYKYYFYFVDSGKEDKYNI